MKIAIMDVRTQDYNVQSVYQIPLGGSQSAACYLCEALAKLGHDVHLITNTTKPGKFRGVDCLELKTFLTQQQLRALELDVLIILLVASNGIQLRTLLPSTTRLVLWTGHSYDQPGVQALCNPAERDVYDGIAMVSRWQAQQFHKKFGIDPTRTGIMRNAIAPAFAGLFTHSTPLLAQKTSPRILAYNTTPFRGLEILLNIFPRIREQVPGTRLEVFSSMKVYMTPQDQEARDYGPLYQRCRQIEGVEYIGSLPQPELAQRLRRIAVLAYPNTFEETSCISVMEAMAAGCRVVTSDRGALPETTAGFAELIPTDVDQQGYQERFINKTLAVLKAFDAEPAAEEDLLRRQIDFVNTHYLWSVRALEWTQWLSSLSIRKASVTSSMDQMIHVALQHHQAGRLAEAETVCRRILDQQPKEARAMNLLGIIASERGENQLAAQWVGRAIAADPATARYHNNLGLILIALGQSDAAVKAYRDAIRLAPDFTEAHNNLGSALKQSGQLEAAIAAFQEALRLKPDYAEAHNNLGNAWQDQNQLPAAIEEYRLAIGFKPDLAEAYNNLGNVLKDQGQLDAALGAYREALRIKPDYAQAHSNLGVALLARGQFDQAAAACREAIRLKPDFAQAFNNLGNVFKEQDRLEEAISQYRLAIGLKPDLAEVYNNLGNALKEQNKLDEAISQYRLAIGLKPDLAEAYNNLGALNDRGQVPQAIAAYRTAMQLKSNFHKAHSNLIFAMHLDSPSDAQAIHHELLRWNRQHAEPLKEFIKPQENDRDPERRLKIGYVSGDFREHVVGWNLLPLFKEHHHESFEIFGYANSFRDDAVTGQLRSCADVWRNITNMSDRQAAQIIREDQIDILVDLALHTADNRLTLFAYKPAPVQITWLGYPGSTGLETIDYRFSDPYLDPPDADLTIYSEQTLRLPDTYWCYRPGGPTPEPAPPPVIHAKYVTFGCLNNFSKVSPKVLVLWTQILHRVPQSRLILHSKPGAHLESVRERFNRAGIRADCLEFAGLQPWEQYIQTYGRIDIALDPFPYNGGITTCDSLYMGVPVVSLSGKTAVGRAGRSILSNIGLPELIAQTPEQYVEIAVKLADDWPRLEELRKTLRQRMQASPLMDAGRFACNIEAAYREMWRRWCSDTAAPQI